MQLFNWVLPDWCLFRNALVALDMLQTFLKQFSYFHHDDENVMKKKFSSRPNISEDDLVLDEAG